MMERPRSRRSTPPERNSSRKSESLDRPRKKPGLMKTCRIKALRLVRQPLVMLACISKIACVCIVGCFILGSNDGLEGWKLRGFKEVKESMGRGAIQTSKILLPVSGEQIMKDAGFLYRPRTIGYYFEDLTTDSFLGTQRLDPNLQRRLTHNIVPITPRAIKAQRKLTDSEDYQEKKDDVWEEGDCVAMRDWQKKTFPTCNTLHENALFYMIDEHYKTPPVHLFSNGYWRDVWMIRDYRRKKYALKTLRYEHSISDRNFDRHRRDAVAMERLTASSNVVNIFAFCGNSGIFEYSSLGDLSYALFDNEKHKLTHSERLVAAYHVASGMADMHNVEKEGQAAMAHTDITPSQFLKIDGTFKLNDFNRCRFLRWNKKRNEPCSFEVGMNPGIFRAPEEYAYEGETEMVDVYSMGNVFYSVLTSIWPFEDVEEDEAVQKMVMKGQRPVIPEELMNSNEKEVAALRKAIQLCWAQEPTKRASAREVAKYLERELDRLKLPKTL